MKNQDNMQATYNVEEPIDILFDQMDKGQEFTIAGNLPSFIGICQTWMSQRSSLHRIIHMHIAFGRVSQTIIAHE